MALQLGNLTVETPVVLAPMAGITNAAYRRLCLEQMGDQGADGLFVCEMITSRGLVEGDELTKSMLTFDEAETGRSDQLSGTDPAFVGKAHDTQRNHYGHAPITPNFRSPPPQAPPQGRRR